MRLERRAENELSCLEAIHLFVEILDTYFSHVCELDLVWHFHKARRTRDADILRRVADLRAACSRARQVYMILDEFILAGEIQETSKKARWRWCTRRTARRTPLTPLRGTPQVILERMEELEKIEAQDSGNILERLAAS